MEFPWMLPTVMISIGLIIFFIGYSIKVYKKHHLIAGFKESKLKGKAAIADLIGSIEIFGGLVDIALGISALYFPEWAMALFVAALLFTILLIIVAAFLAAEFKPGRR